MPHKFSAEPRHSFGQLLPSCYGSANLLEQKRHLKALEWLRNNSGPAQNNAPVGRRISFDTFIQAIVHVQLISHMDAVRRFIKSCDSQRILKLLQLPDTTLLNVWQVAEVDARAKALAVAVFEERFGRRSQYTKDFNRWDVWQVRDFLSIFGASMRRLDVRGVRRSSLYLRYVSRYCPNLEELKCSLTEELMVDELRPLFSRLQRLRIADCAFALRVSGLFNQYSPIKCLSFEGCKSVALPNLAQLPLLVSLNGLAVNKRRSVRAPKIVKTTRTVGRKMFRVRTAYRKNCY